MSGLGPADGAENASSVVNPEGEGEEEESVRNGSPSSLFGARGADKMEDELMKSCDEWGECMGPSGEGA